jgi:capsular polysaccharide biosynthesis protein
MSESDRIRRLLDFFSPSEMRNIVLALLQGIERQDVRIVYLEAALHDTEVERDQARKELDEAHTEIRQVIEEGRDGVS